MSLNLLKADKDKKSGKNNNAIFEAGYHSMGGFVVGMVIANFWEELGLPRGDDTKITNAVFTGKPIENATGFSIEKLYQTVLATGIMSLELLGVKGSMAAGGGMLLGFTYMQNSKSGKYVGQV